MLSQYRLVIVKEVEKMLNNLRPNRHLSVSSSQSIGSITTPSLPDSVAVTDIAKSLFTSTTLWLLSIPSFSKTYVKS